MEDKRSAVHERPISPALRHKRLTLTLITLGIFVFLLMLYSYKTETLFYVWDEPVFRYFAQLRENSAPWVTPAARIFGRLGSQGITVITIILLAIWAFRRRKRYFSLLFAAVVGVELLWLPLVFGIGRPRPNEVRTVFDIVLPGYPSGHVMLFIAFFGALVYLFFARVRNHPWRWIVLLLYSPS